MSITCVMPLEKEVLEKAFTCLRPACNAFIKEPNEVNANLMKNALIQVPEVALENYLSYILIPLEITLKNNKCV